LSRVTITLKANGDIDRVCSDEPIELYFVSPHTPEDRVYLFAAVNVGPQHVRQEIGGFAVGHADDGTLQTGGPVSPKLPPSRPQVRPVQ
jgi:hypothetical protein